MANFVVWIFVVAILLMPSTVCAEEMKDWKEYYFGWGTAPEMEVGAISLIHISSLLNDRISSIDHFLIRPVNCFIALLICGPMVENVAHEFLGHGGRAREFGFKIYGYKLLSLTEPGAIYIEPIPYTVEPRNRMLFSAGGSEASIILNYEVQKMFYSGKKVPRYYFFYFLGGKFVDMYLFIPKEDPRRDPLGFLKGKGRRLDYDPIAYLLGLTEKYGYYDGIIPPYARWVYNPPDPTVYVNDFFIDSAERLQRAAELVLFDPVLISGLIGIYKYIVNNEKEFEPLMFKIGGLRFMPGTRANMGGLGPENYLDLYMIYNKVPFSIYYRFGGNMREEVIGVGIEVRNITLTNNLSTMGQLDLWSNNGFNIETGLCYQPKSGIGIFGKLGYKTEGPLIGRKYSAGFSWLGKISLAF